MSDRFAIDLETARAMADSFAMTTGVRSRLLSAQGDILYQCGVAAS